MGHLSIVAGQMDKNLMPVINLAPLWGPNILTVDSQAGHLGRSSPDYCGSGPFFGRIPILLLYIEVFPLVFYREKRNKILISYWYDVQYNNLKCRVF